jgi:hypothetical protein
MKAVTPVLNHTLLSAIAFSFMLNITGASVVFAGGGGSGPALCEDTRLLNYESCTISSLSYLDESAVNVDSIAKDQFDSLIQLGNQYTVQGCRGLAQHGIVTTPDSPKPLFLGAYSRTDHSLFTTTRAGFGIRDHFPLVTTITIKIRDHKIEFFQDVQSSMINHKVQKVAVANCQ